MELKTNHHLILAPIRGITTAIYRNAISRSFGGIDSTFSPYIITREDEKLNQRSLIDANPKHNDLPLVGQVLTKEVDQFLQVADIYDDMGLKEINLNMGCPYPMVANRTKGSGLLAHPKKVETLLSGILDKCPIDFSVKIRLGRENISESKEIIKIINKLKIKKLTIHARLGIQIYKGHVDLDAFEQCLLDYDYIPCYNGDIKTLIDFNQLKLRFPEVNRWMIGRGALVNPAIFAQIKGVKFNKIEFKNKLQIMHNEIAKGHIELDNGKSDFLNKMKGQWFYLSESFENKQKVFKKIKKIRHIDQYEEAISWIFEQDLKEELF